MTACNNPEIKNRTTVEKHKLFTDKPGPPRVEALFCTPADYSAIEKNRTLTQEALQ